MKDPVRVTVTSAAGQSWATRLEFRPIETAAVTFEHVILSQPSISSLLKNSSAAWNFAISSAKTARKQGKKAVFAPKSRVLSLRKGGHFLFSADC